ncbi:YtzI protein [Oceanobacillus sp. CAU 1775]
MSLVFIGLVVVLSLATISKGYGYKHKIDPHPDEEIKEELNREQKNNNPS